MPAFLAPLLGWLFAILSRFGLLIFRTVQRGQSWLKASLAILLIQGTAALTIKVLGSLGIGFVTYYLGSFGLDILFNQLTTQIGTLPEIALRFMKIANIDEAINILFGAISARLALAGFNLASKRTTTTFYA